MAISGTGHWRRLTSGWRIQVRVIRALMTRELITRFGRENIGFLWLMVEPLLFAGLVGLLWTFMRGGSERAGIATSAFIATGYVPLQLFRHSATQAIGLFNANASLMYHRQIKLLDFIFVRFLVEMIGSMMCFVFISLVLHLLGLMPIPSHMDYLLAGFALYSLFTLSLCLILAPLSERSEVFEKLLPVTIYIMIPFSGTFTMNSWLAPKIQQYMIYSPFVDSMEMIRYGVFGDLVDPVYSIVPPLIGSMLFMVIGLAICRRTRRQLVVE